MKRISIVVPCYNDARSIKDIWMRTSKLFSEQLYDYDFEIIFVDDCSKDNTWKVIEEVCTEDLRCKGIHNYTNFGPDKNILHSLTYGSGDATFLIFGDLQEPLEILAEFIKYWEEGYNSVIGIHPNTKDKGIMALGRKIYYRFASKISNDRLIANFDTFGLYDRCVIEAIKQVNNSHPSISGLIAEYGGKIKKLEVEQVESARGKSNFNFMRKYDVAMVNLTSYTRNLLRMSTFIGMLAGAGSVIFAIIALILKCINWNNYPMGIPTIIIGIFMLGGVQLFFLGIMGEYIMCINERSMGRPLVICDKKINFEE